MCAREKCRRRSSHADRVIVATWPRPTGFRGSRKTTRTKCCFRESRTVHNTRAADRYGDRHSRLLAVGQLLVARTGTTLHDRVARPAPVDMRNGAGRRWKKTMPQQRYAITGSRHVGPGMVVAIAYDSRDDPADVIGREPQTTLHSGNKRNNNGLQLTICP